MANRRVALVRLCKTEKGWRRYPAVVGKNGRVRPGYVRVGDEERYYPEGRYQLRRYEGSKMVYVDAPANAADALAEKHKAERVLGAIDVLGKAEVKVEITEEAKRPLLDKALIAFVEATRARGSLEAAEVYQAAGTEFLAAISKRYADELEPGDITQYLGELRKRKLSDRTIANRHQRVMAFLRYMGLPTKQLSPRKPAYEEQLPEVYTTKELREFFASLTDERLALVFELFLKTGMREQEVMHLRWADINEERGTLRVRSNPDHKFKVKDAEQRDIPLPPDLLAKLQTWRKTHPGKLVTGTAADKPDSKLLRALKRAVSKANLGCFECGTCIERDECEHWYLHKFRATYITKLLQSGMDLRTAMKLSGHADLASVMRYLSPASSEAVQQHVAQVNWM